MKWISIWRVIALCASSLLLPAMACPSQCICKWKNGKRYVECLDKDLKQIPSGLDPETQVLDFTGNDLQFLSKEIFQKSGLIELQKIYLQSCRIHNIDNYAFKGVANLVELDLSNNHLSVIPTPNFIYFPSLMRLSLSNNPITVVKAHCFHHLTYLNTLELSECKIDSMEEDAFSGLLHLEWLRLNGNKLATLRGDNIFPDTLRGIELQNNHWHCDCEMLTLHDWLLKFKMPYAVEPICSTPERLWKRKITSVAINELACPPTISPTTVFLETNESNNITLECLVKATPEAEITWRFQGQPIQNDSLKTPGFKRNYNIIGAIDKRSELLLFNVNADDNGTYTCVAENIAGRVHGNYTLKVIIKEEPAVVIVTFPRRHLVIIVTGIFLVIVLIIAIVAVVLLKFKTDSKSRKKKECGKDVALRNQNAGSSRNVNLTNLDTLQRKFNGSVITSAQTHHIVHYTVQDNAGDTYRPSHIKNVVDRNPDLINDAETITNNMYSDGTIIPVYSSAQNSIADDSSTYSLPPIRQVTWRDQQGINNPISLPPQSMYTMYQHSADVHLNPDCFLDSEGYPYDYGLPKVQCRAPMQSNYSVVTPGYQTLPHKRSNGQKFGCKFAKDTEFNTPPCFSYSFRNNVKGYPVVAQGRQTFINNDGVYVASPELVPSPPEGYKSDSPCCGPSSELCSSRNNPKGTCAVMVPIDIVDSNVNKCYHVETRCVDTQTVDLRHASDDNDRSKPVLKLLNTKCELEVCTESPDEGYVGEAVDVNDT